MRLKKVGGRLVLEADCHGCDMKRCLGSRVCMGEVMSSLVEARCDVEEVTLRGVYKVSYDASHVKVLLELADALRELWAEAPWEGVLDPERRNFLYNLLVNDVRLDPKEALERLREVRRLREEVEGKSPYVEILRQLEAKLSKLRATSCELSVDLLPRVSANFAPRIELEVPSEVKLVEVYDVENSRIRIYEHPEGQERLYYVEPPELWLSPCQLKTLHEAITELETSEIVSSASSEELRHHFRRKGQELLLRSFKERGLEPTASELEDLTDILVRYTVGYGILEVLLKDKRVQDVYVDAPLGMTPIYLNHADHDECVTNIYLDQEELERVASRIRTRSGRAFDTSIPVVDAELELSVRVAGIREPVTFGDIAYAFRKHRERPWTLPMLMKKGLLDVKAAGLLSFLVAAQQSILITGPRGCGKTSLLAALLAEVPRRFRIIVLEDTPELPVRTLRNHGWKIQHLRCASPIFSEGYELRPEENLRAALRLGESVLVLGEVRGKEARVLFEAMRIGAAGNVVLGTIHGSSPYDTWDRIVNDLGVPSSSFKATDIVVSVGYKQTTGRRVRRLMSITEVRKHWSRDPMSESGFHDQLVYDARSDSMRDVGLEKSEVLERIAKLRGNSVEDCLAEIEHRGAIKAKLLELAEEQGLQALLEADFVARSNERFLKLLAEERSPREAYERWVDWLHGLFS